MLYKEFECSSESTSFRKRSFYKIVKTPTEKQPKRAQNAERAHIRFYAKSSPVVTTVYLLLPMRRQMSSSEDKCEVSVDKHKDRRKMEYFREAINSTEGRKRKSKPPLEKYIKMTRSKMQRDAIFLLGEKA